MEHILLALLTQGRGLTAEILRELGVDIGKVTQRVEAALEKTLRVAYEETQVYATPRIPSLLQNDAAEAERLKDEFLAPSTFLSSSRLSPGGSLLPSSP